MKIFKNVCEAIGSTPLIQLSKITAGCNATVLVKTEKTNPGGSSKDRAALFMVEAAERAGLLTPNAPSDCLLIEPTSGNTGVALAMIAAQRGYSLILTMPDTMSLERRKLAELYGAEVVLTDGRLGMQGAIDRAYSLQRSYAAKGIKAWIPSQFDNPANPAAHEATTGVEIWNDTDGKVDIFVATVGTGGTFSGCARALKQRNSRVQAVAVEPARSPVLSGGDPAAHRIQGIGAGFIPNNMELALADTVLSVSDEAAIEMFHRLAREEGLLAGLSSGACVCAALKMASRPENAGRLIVALLPDTGERYLSTV